MSHIKGGNGGGFQCHLRAELLAPGFIDCVQNPSEIRVVESLRRQQAPQQHFRVMCIDKLVHSVQRAARRNRIKNHGLDHGAHINRHPSLGSSVNGLNEADSSAKCRHDRQMIHAANLHLLHDRINL